MAEYNLGFSEKLIDAATAVVDDGLEAIDEKRTVLYLSLLSSEITLKALLKKAGFPINKIKKLSHDLGGLLNELGSCEIEIEIGNGINKWVSCARIRAVVVDERYANATVVNILESESAGASSYPNQIRYGENPAHYPPELVLRVAVKNLYFAREHWESIRAAELQSRQHI